MSRLTRDGTAKPVSRDQILRRERGQGNIHFPCSADHEQDRQPYPVDPYYCYMCDHTYIHNPRMDGTTFRQLKSDSRHLNQSPAASGTAANLTTRSTSRMTKRVSSSVNGFVITCRRTRAQNAVHYVTSRQLQNSRYPLYPGSPICDIKMHGARKQHQAKRVVSCHFPRMREHLFPEQRHSLLVF